MREGSDMSDIGPDEIAAEVFRRADAPQRLNDAQKPSAGDAVWDEAEAVAELAEGMGALAESNPDATKHLSAMLGTPELAWVAATWSSGSRHPTQFWRHKWQRYRLQVIATAAIVLETISIA